MEPIIGTVQLFAFDFAPQGWLVCNGEVFNVTTHEQLFSLIGFNYGSQGRSFYKLPDLTDKSPLPQMKYYICYEGHYPSRP